MRQLDKTTTPLARGRARSSGAVQFARSAYSLKKQEGPPKGDPSIVLTAVSGDFDAPLTRGETPHEETVVPGPTHAAYDNETLDHLLSMVDDNESVGRFARFEKAGRRIANKGCG